MRVSSALAFRQLHLAECIYEKDPVHVARTIVSIGERLVKLGVNCFIVVALLTGGM